MKTSIKLLIIAAAIAAAVPAQANIQSTLDSVFNSMANTSKPGVYEGIRRGVISGGEVQVRNRIVDINLLTFTPPSWSAGCGGINLFNGAFSFINADQLIAVLRSIPANASGYAFQLAIDAMSELIGNEIKDLFKKIQDVITKYSNSCEIAKLLVDQTLETAKTLYQENSENSAVAAGLSADKNQAKQDNTIDLTKDTELMKAKRGNIVYRSLAEQGVSNWFTGGDESALEEIMSMTGTVIVKLGQEVDGKTQVLTDYYDSTISIIDLVEGGTNLAILKCANSGSDYSDTCTTIKVTKQSELDSLADKIIDALIGDYASTNVVGGIVQKFAESSEDGTAAQQNIISALGTVGVHIHNLAIRNKYIAADFVKQNSKVIAIELTANMAKELLSATKSAVQISQSEHVGEALKKIEHALDNLNTDIRTLYDKYGKPAELDRAYLEKMEILRFSAGVAEDSQNNR